MYGLPNCVPEYFREQQERWEHEQEKEWDRREYYKKCRIRLEKAEAEGKRIFKYAGPECCWNCEYFESVGQTSEYDDWDLHICHNKNCNREIEEGYLY